MKTVLKFPLIIALCASIISGLSAQKVSLDDVLDIELKNMGSIIKGNEVSGYYMFYKMDKVDRNTNAYLLRILDANLNDVSKQKITESKHFYLSEASFDGQSLMFKFYETKEKKAIFYMYDSNAKLKSKKSVPLSKYEIQVVNASKGAEIKGYSLFDLQNKGFLNYATTKDKEVGYEIQFFPEEGAEGWKYKSDPASKDWETAVFLAASNAVLFSTVGKRPSMMSKKLSYHLLGTDLKTGKKLFEKELEDKNHKMQVLNGYTDETTGNVVLFGLYFDDDDNIVKGKSKGLFAMTMDDQGNAVSKKLISWTKDVSKLLPVNKKGKIDDIGYLFFHNIFKTSDGNIFAVGEGYRKTASGLGIAAIALGGNASTAKMVVEDLVIFEFASDFSLKAVKIFDKGKSDILLPAGAEFYSPQMLAYYIRSYGGFDYSFTQMAADKSTFSVGYVDWDRKAKDLVFGTVTRADNDFSTDKLSLKTDASSLRVYAAKPGYVLVSEYFRKKKKLDMRLEKINY